MYGRFKELVSILLDEMVEGVRLEYISKSKRYKRLKGRKKRLSQQILESLSDDKQYLFLEYEESVNAQNALLEDYLYRKGFFHGIRLSGFFMKLFKH